MSTARTPYQDTSVPVERSKEQIRQALKDAGARGVQFDEMWEPETLYVVRFLWAMGEGFDATVRVRLEVKPLPPVENTRSGWSISPEQRERQAWRALAWYMKTMLEAASFGLMRFEDVFLSFVEGEDGRTIGEAVIPMLESGRLALPKGGS